MGHLATERPSLSLELLYINKLYLKSSTKVTTKFLRRCFQNFYFLLKMIKKFFNKIFHFYNKIMFNKNHKIKKFNYPFPFIIIEDFLDTEFFKNLEDNFPSLEEFKLQKNSVKRMDFDTSQDDDLYEKYKLRSKSFNNFHKWVFSVDFCKFFLNLFKNDINNEFEKSFLTHDIKTFNLTDVNYENVSIINKKNY
jgi:hypothetical protein